MSASSNFSSGHANTGTWRPRFAAHLGFPLPDAPLLGALARSDPASQIAAAASLGYAGILDPFAMMRSDADQAAIGQAAAAAGLDVGGFLYAALPHVRQTLAWVDPAIPANAVHADIEAAVAAARRLGSRDIVVLAAHAPGLDREAQCDTMAARLRSAGAIVADAGFRLHVEPVSAERLPEMLLHTMSDAARVVLQADHPVVRLAFDTGHVHANGEDVARSLDRYWPLVGVVQLADSPGRVALGEGDIDFAAVFGTLRSVGFEGLCELEHGWRRPEANVQRSYAARLQGLATNSRMEGRQ